MSGTYLKSVLEIIDRRSLDISWVDVMEIFDGCLGDIWWVSWRYFSV